MKILGILPVAISLTLLSGQAISSSSWNEESFGDFNAGQLVTLTEGDNLFIGTQEWSADPIDGFRFIIPDGYRTTIDVTFEYLNLIGSEETAWIWDLFSMPIAEECLPDWAYDCYRPIGSVLIASEILQTPEGYQDPPNWDYVPVNGYMLEAGYYQLTDNFGFTDNHNSILTYSFNLHTIAAPIPAAIWLFGSGLLGLIGVSRKKKAV